MNNDYKSQAYDALRETIGYPKRGTDQKVTISIDDRTLDFIVKAGRVTHRADNLLDALAPHAEENRKRYYHE